MNSILSHGAPRAKPVVPVRRPCGATSRPHGGAFLHGQRPWSPAVGMKFPRDSKIVFLRIKGLIPFFSRIPNAEENPLDGSLLLEPYIKPLLDLLVDFRIKPFGQVGFKDFLNLPSNPFTTIKKS